MMLKKNLIIYFIVLGVSGCYANTIDTLLESTRFGYAYLNDDGGTGPDRRNLFYWLHYANLSQNFVQRPLILWLHGSSGIGFANFREIGSYYIEGDQIIRRDGSFVTSGSGYNVLFVDSTTGCGFSYGNYVKTEDEIAEGLVKFLEFFYQKYRDFETVPLHIMGESYGGRFAALLAYKVANKIKAGTFNFTLKSVALGNAWISPKGAISEWLPFLDENKKINNDQRRINVENIINQILGNITLANNDTDAYKRAMHAQSWGNLIIGMATNFMDRYNIDYNSTVSKIHYRSNDDLTVFMNTKLKPKFGVIIPDNVVWYEGNAAVYYNLVSNYYQDRMSVVNQLLSEHDNIKVAIYHGILDPVVPIKSTEKWVNGLEWSERHNFDKEQEADFCTIHKKKSLNKLALYYVKDAGHMVPADQLSFMTCLLNDLETVSTFIQC